MLTLVGEIRCYRNDGCYYYSEEEDLTHSSRHSKHSTNRNPIKCNIFICHRITVVLQPEKKKKKRKRKKKDLPREICKFFNVLYCAVKITVLFNCSCVWILTQDERKVG